MRRVSCFCVLTRTHLALEYMVKVQQQGMFTFIHSDFYVVANEFCRWSPSTYCQNVTVLILKCLAIALFENVGSSFPAGNLYCEYHIFGANTWMLNTTFSKFLYKIEFQFKRKNIVNYAKAFAK